MKKIVLVIGILVLIGIVVGVYFYNGSKNNNEPEDFKLMLTNVANQAIIGNQSLIEIINITSGKEINFPHYVGGSEVFSNYSYGRIDFNCTGNITDLDAEKLAKNISYAIQPLLDNLSYVDVHFSCVCGWQITKKEVGTLCVVSGNV